MFTKEQAFIYEVYKDKILGQLKTIIQNSSGSNSAINSAAVCIEVSIKERPNKVQALVSYIYPEDEYKIIREIFCTLNDTIINKSSEHFVFSQLSDPRVFTLRTSKSEYMTLLHQHYATRIVKDVEQWLHQQYADGKINKVEVLKLHNTYQHTILNPPERICAASTEYKGLRPE